MRLLQNSSVRKISRGVYPPSFCSWRMAVAIIAVTQLSVFLIGLGRLQDFNWQWLSVSSTYAQCLALFCAVAVCVCRAWLKRLSSRDAWLGAWVVALVAAISFSYISAVIGSVLGFGPGAAGAPDFMLKSTIAVGLVFTALLRYLYMRSQWQAELAAQSEARVQALQARIRPHFLFNSLNTIASLIETQPAIAERATEDLADLFRGSMRQADTMIPLAEELALAKKYLDMEQRRLGERLQTEWTVESFPDDVFVLPLVLQPLLENAVTHGVQPHEAGGLVKMYASNGPDSIIITISNPRAPEPHYQAGNAGDHGMALENIRARLELAFAEGASLLTHEDQKRFYAVLTIPYDSNPDH